MAAKERPKELLLAKVKNASGRIGIFFIGVCYKGRFIEQIRYSSKMLSMLSQDLTSGRRTRTINMYKLKRPPLREGPNCTMENYFAKFCKAIPLVSFSVSVDTVRLFKKKWLVYGGG